MRSGRHFFDAAGVKALVPGFLIAMPQLADPNFHRSVVLMIEHGQEGSMGLVVNRRSALTLRDLGEAHALKVASEQGGGRVFVGGPVEPQRGFVLHDSDRVPERHEVLPGLYLSVTVDALGPLLLDQKARLRFCLGYSGWGPKQLEREIASGSWLFSEAEGSRLWNAEPEKLWDETLRAMGVDPATILPSGGLQ